MTPVPVWLMGEDALARGALYAQLRDQKILSLLGEGDAGQLSDAVRAQRPGALIWDLGPDSRASLGMAAAVVAAGVPCAALLEDDAVASGALAAGLAAVVKRDAPAEQIAAAAVAVAHGLVAYAAELSPNAAQRTAPLEMLTPREREVLGLLAEGLSNKQIAARLDMSEHTAKFHVTAIISKLGAQSRTDAVVRGARLGLLML